MDFLNNPVVIYFAVLVGLPATIACAYALWRERAFWFDGWKDLPETVVWWLRRDR